MSSETDWEEGDMYGPADEEDSADETKPKPEAKRAGEYTGGCGCESDCDCDKCKKGGSAVLWIILAVVIILVLMYFCKPEESTEHKEHATSPKKEKKSSEKKSDQKGFLEKMGGWFGGSK